MKQHHNQHKHDKKQPALTEPAQRRGGKLLIPAVLVFLSVLIFCVRFLNSQSPDHDHSSRNMRLQKSASLSSALPVLGKAAGFTLTDQLGNPFEPEKLKGKVWVLSFTFTRCEGPCPMMNQKMAGIQNTFEGVSNFHQVSISVDPKYDTPEKLRDFGRKFGARDSRWTFLTGEQSHVISIARDIFRVPAGEDPNMHSTRFVLIDQQGSIRGYYDSLLPESIEALKKGVNLVLGEPSGLGT